MIECENVAKFTAGELEKLMREVGEVKVSFGLAMVQTLLHSCTR